MSKFAQSSWSSPKRPSSAKRTQVLLTSQNDLENNLIVLLSKDRFGAKETCDLTLSINKAQVEVHRLLIEVSSGYFKDLLAKDVFSSTSLSIEDNESDDVENFINSIYLDTNLESTKDTEDNETVADWLDVKVDVKLNAAEKEGMLLQLFNRDRFGKKEYCDATISVEDVYFHVHKCILSVYSSFFAKLFNSEMKEKYQSVTEVTGINCHMMEIVFNFIYTKEIWVCEHELLDILVVADYLGITHLAKLVVTLLENDVCFDNCIQLWRIATKYQCEFLKQNAMDIIEQNFVEVLKKEDFLDVEESLICDFFQCREEPCYETNAIKDFRHAVYVGAIAWTQHKLAERSKLFDQLYAVIRSENLVMDFFDIFVQNKELLQHSQLALADVLNGVPKSSRIDFGTLSVVTDDCEHYNCDLSSVPEPQPPNYVFLRPEWDFIQTLVYDKCNGQFLHFKKKMYNFGGYEERDINSTTDVSIFNNTGHCSSVGEMCEKRQRQAVAAKNGLIYIAGGIGFNNKRLDCMEVFNPRSQTSRMLTPMQQVRCDFALVAYQGYLYAIGGEGRSNCNIRNVERYDPKIDVWKTINQTSPNLNDMTLFRKMGHKVYLVSESNDFDVFVFDLSTEQWIEEHSRATIAMCQVAMMLRGLPGLIAYFWKDKK